MISFIMLLTLVFLINPTFAQEMTLKPIATYMAGFGKEATEIITYDKTSQCLFVVNSDLNTVANFLLP